MFETLRLLYILYDFFCLQVDMSQYGFVAYLNNLLLENILVITGIVSLTKRYNSKLIFYNDCLSFEAIFTLPLCHILQRRRAIAAYCLPIIKACKFLFGDSVVKIQLAACQASRLVNKKK